MANTTYVQVIEDGPRHAIARVTAILDTSNLAATALITKALFTNNDVTKVLTGFIVREVEFTVSAGNIAVLEWEATTPQMIGTFHDSNEVNWAPGLAPNPLAAGYTGSILVRSLNWVATVQSLTLTLRMLKQYS
jgi:hypothetical protein